MASGPDYIDECHSRVIRAEELRAVAQSMTNSEARKFLLRAADDHQGLAKSLRKPSEGTG
jgi:hypothetical protein